MGGCFEISLTFCCAPKLWALIYTQKEIDNHCGTPCISWNDISRPGHEKPETTKDKLISGAVHHLKQKLLTKITFYLCHEKVCSLLVL